MRVAIIGQGYVGLTIAVGAADAGHSVIGFDVNENLVTSLNLGQSHIEGIPNEQLASLASSGAYKAHSDASVIDGSEVIIIAGISLYFAKQLKIHKNEIIRRKGSYYYRCK